MPSSVDRPVPTIRCGLAAVLSVLALLASTSPALALDDGVQGGITVIVVDASGAPVPGAAVTLTVSGVSRGDGVTGADGRFTFPETERAEAAVTVSAPGFEPVVERVVDGTARAVLQPARLSDAVTVTASRGVERLTTPASTTVLTSAELLTTGAGAVDDALRSTPGFSLFRRTSSRVANPTTQGVTLRGLSGSGASRTLVLADGLPLNDAFGSWVYWNRVPQAAIDRVEVLRGAAGDLYGADALGGVIQLLTFSPDRPRLRATIDGGSHGTARGSLFAGGKHRGWTGTAAGEWLGTDGVIVVSKADRGRVDVPAQSDYHTGYATAGYDAPGWHASLKAGAYSEDRGNGTPLQVNSTNWRQVSGDAGGLAGGGSWTARVSHGSQDYFQTFTAVAADRASERLTSDQLTPSDFTRAAGQYARPLGAHVVLVGAEGQRTESTSRETRYALNGAPLAPAFTGGTETLSAVYARVNLALHDRVTVLVGGRGDFWRSDPRDAALPEKSSNFFSPRAAVSFKFSPTLSAQASAYRAYRTPTLNELHRAFRAGNVLTNPNPLLEPERLSGVEGGVLAAGSTASFRATAFYNLLDDAISNVTIATTPAQITRQRQNTDQVRATGLELETEIRVGSRLSVEGLAVFTNSVFASTPKQPAIEGNRIPQVPRYQLGAGLTYVDPRIATFAVQGRYVGAQFDDDRNLLELRRFGVLDFSISRAIVRSLQAFVAVENLFDEEIETGRTPVTTIGWPRTARVGVRVFMP